MQRRPAGFVPRGIFCIFTGRNHNLVMEAKRVLEIFQEITTIPRESGHEEPMTAWLQRFASDHGLACKTDATGNVLITREASAGYESVPAIVLQSHQDMVCEKLEGVEHDFARDPINYVIEDGWMIARETTLGADDGIGIAASLALLESDLPSGKVEALFTISEETGMDGAEALQDGFFTGKTLINLDSEDEGQLFIGCAGGINTQAVCTFPVSPAGDGMAALSLSVGGAIGGHSGDDINKDRVNAVQQLARFLYSLPEGWRLVSFSGGGKPNAIAREAGAVIAVADAAAVSAAFAEFGRTLAAEFHATDPGVFVKSTAAEAGPALSAADSRRFAGCLFSHPHGVVAMSQDIKDLVETSSNLASVRMTAPGSFVVRSSQRSSVMSSRDMIAARVRAHMELIGAEVEHLLPYPGWTPNLDSPILKVCVESYKRLFGEDPLVLAIHAGLECGLFLDKFPDLDMISFGPTLRGVHAPGEKLELKSLDRFVALLTDVVCHFR